MPDDMLKDAIETSRRIIQGVTDFESEGLACAERIKTEFDSRWSPYWHCIIGRNFGSFVTHETKNFIFFYLGDKAVMLFKAG
jgi:dynein light chain LC8-type